MWNELGISGGTAIIILIALYFVIKWAVKNGIKEAYRTWIGFGRSITSRLRSDERGCCKIAL